MTRALTLLGIESSCDETAAAVVRGLPGVDRALLSNVVWGQMDQHAAFGGVVPEIAARAHADTIDLVIAEAMKTAQLDFAGLDAIAVTAGPGLIGGVIVGLMTAKALAAASRKPLIAVNHLEGHALTVRLTDDVAFPYLLLLVSGGHCQLLDVRGVGDYVRLGTTIDDAAGEAFDKVGKLLGLPFPGGPAVERAAQQGDPKRFHLPRPMKGEDHADFSFSGLKTAVRQLVEKQTALDDQTISDIAAAFQLAVADSLADRVTRAQALFTAAHPGGARTLVVAGGVAANQALRARLQQTAAQDGFRLVVPPVKLCTDNGAMIAWAGLERFALGLSDPLTVLPRPRWPLDPRAAPVSHKGPRR